MAVSVLVGFFYTSCSESLLADMAPLAKIISRRGNFRNFINLNFSQQEWPSQQSEQSLCVLSVGDTPEERGL